MFRHVDPTVWRQVGRALNLGAIPDEQTSAARAALCRVLDLPLQTSDAEIARELEYFKRHGKRRI